MVKKEVPDYKELLILERLAHPHEARKSVNDEWGVISIVEYSFEELLDDRKNNRNGYDVNDPHWVFRGEVQG